MVEEIPIIKIERWHLLLAESSNDLKRLLKKVKGESTKARLQPNKKTTEIMTTEETHNFNTDDEDTKMKDFVYLGSVISSSGDSSQEIRSRRTLGRTAMEELGKVSLLNSERKSKGGSLKTNVKITAPS